MRRVLPASRARTPLAFIESMAATQVAELPRGPEWSYEIKLDGYRVLAVKSGDDVRLLSRRNKDVGVAGSVPAARSAPCG